MAQGRLYTIQFGAQAVTAAIDFLELLVPSDAVMALREVRITQSTEAGDAASEQLRFQIKRATGTYTSGSGGAVSTLNKVQTGDAAAGITGEQLNTTQAAAGTGALTTLLEEAENVHNGWLHKPPPDERLIFSPGEACVISLPAAPADSVSFSLYALVEEIGG